MPQCAQCGYTTADAFAFCPSCGTRSHPGGGGLIGRILNGKYRIVSEIGEGSMGKVYLGEHTALHRKIALKVLHDTLVLRDEVLQRFQREGIAAGRLDHPNAIQIFDFDRTEDGLFFLAMEHVRGENLRQRLQRTGPMSPEQAVEVMLQLTAVLAAAHEQGIVHRDLKPENLMIVEGQDGALQLKVLDFGLSRLVDRQQNSSLMTVAGRLMGTPLYMAPEQWRGEEADHRSDLYAACLCCYEMVAGRNPFQGANMTETFVKSTTQPPPSLYEQEPKVRLPAGFDELVQHGLRKDREERYQSAQQLAEALEGIDFSRAAKPRTVRPRRQPASATGRRTARAARTGHAVHHARGARPWLWAGIGAAVLAIAAVVLWPRGGADARSTAPLVSLHPEAGRTEAQRGYLALLDNVRDLWRSGDLPGALIAATKATRHECADAEAFAVRGEVYLRRRDYDTAKAEYDAALKRLPGYADAEAGLGWVSLQRSDVDSAARHFDAAVAADANCADALAGRAAVLCRRGDFAGACKVLDPVAAGASEAARLHLWRGQAQLGLLRIDDAVASFVQSKRADPSLAEASEGLGDAYSREGDLDAAEQQYQQALQVSGEVRVRRKLAELLVAAGRFQPAADVLKPAADAGTQDGSLHVLQALIAQGRGDHAAAIAELEQAVAQGAPEPAQVHLLLGTLLFEAQRFADAVVQLQRAADADDQLAASYRTWGLALFRMADYTSAAFRLERARKLEPKDPLTLYTLGVLYMDYLAQPQEAAAQFRAYREAGGRDPKVNEWLQRLSR
jgi:serine/threonine-protein kinase